MRQLIHGNFALKVRRISFYLSIFYALLLVISCSPIPENNRNKTASEILGNPDYEAISYGGYRLNTRDTQPTPSQLKEDMKILSAIGIKIVRTYNVQYDQAANLLKVIHELKQENEQFEMYVMLGAWIDCKNAWTDSPERIRNIDNERNAGEIDRAVALANQYPDIVKIIAVGNEAMVKWAWDYYVEPAIILNWVNHLQDLKKSGKLPKDIWITSSDNFASWGGGGKEYHVDQLNQLIRAVDYISMHTYPMHDTHYNPDFWGVPDKQSELTDKEKIDAAMLRAKEYAINQYQSVVDYMHTLGVNKPVHIGETGWATQSNGFYGNDGSRATDEYKAKVYHDKMREWTNSQGISCFYFEAFDEQWKDAGNPLGSENHFGLINLQSEAKHVLWDLVDEGKFEGLTRDGKPISKTYNGDLDALMKAVKVPPSMQEIQMQSKQ